MPKPNRYQGNGKLYPEGTTMGRYVMRNGHWVDQDSPVARSPHSEPHRGLPGWIVTAMLAVLTVLFILALTGCSINVVNVVHSDIGVTTQLVEELTQ